MTAKNVQIKSRDTRRPSSAAKVASCAHPQRPAHRPRTVHRPFYRRFFPHFLRQVAEDRFVVLNVDGHPVGLSRPGGASAGDLDGTLSIQLQLDEAVLLELEALGARIAMEGIYLFDAKDDPTASGLEFSDYANRLHAIASLAVTS